MSEGRIETMRQGVGKISSVEYPWIIKAYD